MTILPIEQRHGVADVVPQPRTRDPFDNLLLARCQVEGLRPVSMDAAMAGHPLVLTTL